jgi:hypothetical protein
MTMTIDEAKAAKKALRERINQALREFTDDTGLLVESFYRATPERWQNIESAVEVASQSIEWIVSDEAACLLELRARVEALEANSKPTSNPRQIRSSLVERVADAIAKADDDGLTNMTWSYHARAAIREVLAYLCEHELIGNYARRQIEQEVDQ